MSLFRLECLRIETVTIKGHPRGLLVRLERAKMVAKNAHYSKRFDIASLYAKKHLSPLRTSGIMMTSAIN